MKYEEKRKSKLIHYKLKIVFKNREILDELVDEKNNKRLNGTL